MPHSSHTRLVRKCELARIKSLANRLSALERELHEKCVEPTLAPETSINEAKVRRSARLEQKLRHKPRRSAVGPADPR